VILASPTYTNNVSSLMKNLMDRIAYTAHRPAFIGKPAMLVTTASSMTGATLRALSWFGFTGFEVVSQVGVSWWPSPHRAWREERAFGRRFERAVRRFERALVRGPARSLSLWRVLQLSVGKATATIDPKFFPADHAYHHGRDIDQHGFAVSGWKKALGRLAHGIVVGWMERQLPARSTRAPAGSGGVAKGPGGSDPD
jgi:hypothetical protein